jgi:hypothetical protein
MRTSPHFKRRRENRARGARMVTGWRRTARRLRRDESGATTLEWALLLAVVAIPSYWIFKTCLNMLVDYYHMMSMLNSLPFP